MYMKAEVECVLERPWLELNLTAVPVPPHIRRKDFLVVVCRVCSWCALTGNVGSAGVTCVGKDASVYDCGWVGQMFRYLCVRTYVTN